MIVQVGHLNGEVRCYSLSEQSTAGELISMLSSELACSIQLISAGSMISASAVLGVDSVYYVTVDADGGKKKKKKKKNWATKKKIKHRHRKVKLATLKLYTVGANDVIQRSRKQCPSCPPGVYMAKHFDRHYCGTCHETLKMDEATIKANLEALRKQQKAKADAAGAAAATGAVGGAAAKKGDKKDAKKAAKKK